MASNDGLAVGLFLIYAVGNVLNSICSVWKILLCQKLRCGIGIFSSFYRCEMLVRPVKVKANLAASSCDPMGKAW